MASPTPPSWTSDEEKNDSQSDSLIGRDIRNSSPIWRLPATEHRDLWVKQKCLLSILIILLGSISLSFIWVSLLSWSAPKSSYEHGFRTDMKLPFSLPVVETRFHNSPLFPAEHKMAMPLVEPGLSWPENVSYYGNPGSEDEDRNWDMITEPEAIPLTLEEAQHAWPENYQEYYIEDIQGYQAVSDVRHNLHCLNTLRKMAFPEIYSRTNNIHVYHCIDVLRQALMCTASTTLVPSRYHPEIHHDYVDSNQVHTCRDFKKLNDYLIARATPGNPLYVGRQPKE